MRRSPQMRSCRAILALAASAAMVAAILGSALAQDAKPKPGVPTLKPQPYQMTAEQLRCAQAKYPDCPSGCVKDDKAHTCSAPIHGYPVGQVPTGVSEGYCEGYYPDCPQFCRKDEAARKCVPIDTHYAIEPRKRPDGG